MTCFSTTVKVGRNREGGEGEMNGVLYTRLCERRGVEKSGEYVRLAQMIRK